MDLDCPCRALWSNARIGHFRASAWVYPADFDGRRDLGEMQSSALKRGSADLDSPDHQLDSEKVKGKAIVGRYRMPQCIAP